MAKKKKEESLRDKIKQMEQEKRKESMAKVKTAEKLMSFDSWFHQRKDSIKSCHRKEIILADFKSRGVSSKATMAEFDKALELYGIKLK